MGRHKGSSLETRDRLLAAVGRGFRESGFGGIGVDGLAREAGLTSGAFYGIFDSKSDAFRESVVVGLRELKDGIRKVQAAEGPGWVAAFAKFYLGFKRTCDLSNGCALPTFSTEVERSGPEIRAAYRKELEEIVDTVAKGLPGTRPESRRKKAMALMALLAGGVTMARAVDDVTLSEEIATATIQAAVRLTAASPPLAPDKSPD